MPACLHLCIEVLIFIALLYILVIDLTDTAHVGLGFFSFSEEIPYAGRTTVVVYAGRTTVVVYICVCVCV